MPRTQLRHACIKEFISASAYFRKLRNTDRSDSAAFFRLFIRADNGKIDLLDLIEQCGALRFIKLIIIFKQVLLPEICKFCICLRISVYIFAVWNAHVFLPPFCNWFAIDSITGGKSRIMPAAAHLIRRATAVCSFVDLIISFWADCDSKDLPNHAPLPQ